MSGTLHTSTGLDFPHNIVELTAIDGISNHDADAPESNDTLNASRFADERVPDGGYGWVVVLSCAILAWWFVGITYSWGVIQGVLVKDGLSSASTLSFVGSLTVACLAIFAIVNARIIRLLGARDTAILGVLFFGVGQILSSFTTHNIAGLFVTTGMTMGIGARYVNLWPSTCNAAPPPLICCSLCFMVVSVVPAQYFSKKRGLANGIVFAGGGLGGAAISFATNSLIQRVGPAWTYRALGMMTLLTGIPAAWLIKERTPIRSATFIEW